MPVPEIRTVPVPARAIPPELSRLYDLAYNLWWTWCPEASVLFSMIDSGRWIRSHNPIDLLLDVEPHRWDSLVRNEEFLASYQAVLDRFDRYMSGAAQSWFPREHPRFADSPVAYLCAEYAWHDSLRIYAGGLGVLAGDHCKEASDLGLPFVGVGLLYRRGYFRQTVDADGHQQHFYPDLDFHRIPARPVVGPGGRELRVPVTLGERKVWLRVWKVAVGRVQVLLLDSDLRENQPADRPITSILYVRGRETRLCQEILLGMGAVRVLSELGIRPAVWHLNEGHSAFAALERIRESTERGASFAEAVDATSRNSVFTTHTTVLAGNECFDGGLVRRYVEPWAAATGVRADEVMALGAPPHGEDGSFHLTALAVRTSRGTNGVSRLHGRVAESIWGTLGGTRGTRVDHITNGVHVPTWLGPEMSDLLRRHLGRDFHENLLDEGFGEAVEAIPDGELWSAHEAQKRRLLRLVREKLFEQAARHGRSPDELRAAETCLDPGSLTLGVARRFATYKRANLLFHDRRRLESILAHGEGPVQIVFSGKAHPADRAGQDLIREVFDTARSDGFRGRIVFVEDYDLRVARFLVQGVDLWVNTPRRPLEASGTSGMKAAVNGGLNLSVLDGWWCEGYDPSHGWVIGGEHDDPDPSAQDRVDAGLLYEALEGEIVPGFFRRDASGLPTAWIGRMKRAIAALAPRFGTCRMVRDYVERAYLPAARAEDRNESVQPPISTG